MNNLVVHHLSVNCPVCAAEAKSKVASQLPTVAAKRRALHTFQQFAFPRPRSSPMCAPSCWRRLDSVST